MGRAETVGRDETRARNAGSGGGGRAAGPTRRFLIRVAAVLAFTAAPATVAGCGLLDREPDPAPEPDPIEPLLTGALDLAGRYDAAIAAFPGLAARLGPLAEAHRAHAGELARTIGASVPTTPAGAGGSGAPEGSAAPSGGDQAATLAALRAAEQEGRQAAVTICLAVPADRAALAGSIAAARATHAEVLR